LLVVPPAPAPHTHDPNGGDVRSAAARNRLRRGRGAAPPARHRRAGRPPPQPGVDSLHDAGDVPVSRPLPAVGQVAPAPLPEPAGGSRMRRALRCIPALLALGAAGGCGYLPIGPTYHRPSLEVPPAYKESKDWKPAEPQELTSRGEWWELYGDADLDALERQVQVSNQNVLLAAAKYDQALALLGTARSGYFPTITADVSSTRSQSGGGSSTASASAAAAGKSTTTQDRVSLATNWEIDVWGRVRRTVESNRAAAQASAGDLAAMLLSEQATLAQAYFQLRVTDLDLALLERSMAGYPKALEATQSRYRAGVAQRSDVTQAQ